jgi:fluoroacetyl-CoA thioesterase
MPNIPIGTKGEFRTLVTPEIAVDFLGLESARVLGTPFLIMLLEMTARNSLKPLLDPGFDSVGTLVSVRHLAATPIGMNVTFRTEIQAVDGRRILFKVEAFDDREPVADGTHERFIVNVDRFAERLKEKIQG